MSTHYRIVHFVNDPCLGSRIPMAAIVLRHGRTQVARARFVPDASAMGGACAAALARILLQELDVAGDGSNLSRSFGAHVFVAEPILLPQGIEDPVRWLQAHVLPGREEQVAEGATDEMSHAKGSGPRLHQAIDAEVLEVAVASDASVLEHNRARRPARWAAPVGLALLAASGAPSRIRRFQRRRGLAGPCSADSGTRGRASAGRCCGEPRGAGRGGTIQCWSNAWRNCRPRSIFSLAAQGGPERDSWPHVTGRPSRSRVDLARRTPGERADHALAARKVTGSALGSSEDADFFYDEANKEDGTFAPALMGHGEIAARQGSLAAAVQWYGKAVGADPKYKQVYQSLAWAECNQGKYDEAERAATKALKIDPDYAGAKQVLAAIHQKRALRTSP